MTTLSKYKAEGPETYPVEIITAPAASNPNLRAQEGVFTLFRPREELVDRRPLEVQLGSYMMAENVLKANELGQVVTFTEFTLPQSESGKLLWILANSGVSAATLFPGYRGAALAVNEECLWERPSWSVFERQSDADAQQSE